MPKILVSNHHLPVVDGLLHSLAQVMEEKLNRNTFFQILAQELSRVFHYDRFCINLYDAEREFLNLFTAPDGTIIESLSNTRVARNTIAGQAISSRKPVVINNISQNMGDGIMPLSAVGLNSTIALPLIFNQEVLATLHVSFVRQPDNIVDILNLLLDLRPIVTPFLAAMLAEEKIERAAVPKGLPAKNKLLGPSLESRLLETPCMAEIMGIAAKVAKLNIPVLIVGETGTGKSMLARWLHNHSPRHNQNFIQVNCPSLAPTLFESEMFGYAKGAFTGATTKHVGRIEMAQYGTLFLDEIGDLAPEMQSKLLQVLEHNSFERVGEASPIGVDIRVISATNVDLPQAMAQGLLRRDLYYRLSAVVIRMPPLRERKVDIPLFVEHFVAQFGQQYEIKSQAITKAVLNILCSHTWPGNIRELRNVVSRILLHSLDSPVTESFVADMLNVWKDAEEKTGLRNDGRVVEAKNLNTPKRASSSSAANEPDLDQKDLSLANQETQDLKESRLTTLWEHEREYLQKALEATNWRVSGPNGAAAILGIPRTTLQHKMRKFNLKRPDKI